MHVNLYESWLDTSKIFKAVLAYLQAIHRHASPFVLIKMSSANGTHFVTHSRGSYAPVYLTDSMPYHIE